LTLYFVYDTLFLLIRSIGLAHQNQGGEKFVGRPERTQRLSTFGMLFGLFLAVLPDFGSGLLSAKVMEIFTGVVLGLWPYLLGIFFAVLPDCDVVLQKFLGNEIDSRHREITHYPLVVIPSVFLLMWAGTGIVGVKYPIFWASLSALALFLHYLHDTMGAGYGVPWFMPFSRTRFEFFGRKNSRRHLIAQWTFEELRSMPQIPLESWLSGFVAFNTECIIGCIYFVLVIGFVTLT
jgi:membrane-bound metal-dependent hydrolase YbcI (DUF457 family)